MNSGKCNMLDDDQESLFENGSSKIDVVKLHFGGAESYEWKELFSGFDEIRAITFSSGLSFIDQLLQLFEYAEIIFGCEDVMSYSLQEIMAFQNGVLERIRKNSTIKERFLDRLNQGKLRFFVAKSQLSHEKIYLLSAKDGRKRVVTGSANMSFNAFGGRQRENICCIDGEEAYDWYFSVYASLKENSTNEISHNAIMVADLEDHLDDLPISETIKAKKAIVVEQIEHNNNDIEFSLNIRNSAKQLQPFMPKIEKKTGITVITPESILKVKRHVQEDAVQKRELRSEYPALEINVSKATATLNGKPLDLSPSKDDVEKDVRLFLKYMDGYSRFHGDYVGMQYRYFEFANWFFCSPFMATMRDMAARFDQNRLPYPVFGLVYGQSKAGKTSFLETLLKMMIGQKPKIPAQDFTRSSIENLKRTVKGAPIIVDDMVNTRFNQHAIETIKTDDFGISDHMTNYSAVVISANEDVKAVSPEVIRRTVICRVEAGLTNTEVMKSNIVRLVQKKIGTAFYRDYLYRMFQRVPELIEAMKDDDTENAPDILALSSEIIVSIFQEFSSLPEYIRPLTLENYFSEQVTGKYAIKTIRSAWKTSKNSFRVNKKNNELRYNAGATYEAERIIKELPETLEARKSREWIIMNLNASQEFFGISFKKRFL